MIFLKESFHGDKTDGIIYVNFGPKEAKLKVNDDGSYSLIEWLDGMGKRVEPNELKQAA